MPRLPCPLGADCNKGIAGAVWETVDVVMEEAKGLLTDHIKYAHQVAAAGAVPATLKAEKLVRPSINVKEGVIDEEDWEYFLHRWMTYKNQANLTVATKSHLESCLGDEVTKILFGRLGQAGWELLTEQTLLDEVRNVFVKKRNRMINRLKLHNLMQGPDQPVQQYVSSLKQIARTCQYSVPCTRDGCNTRVDYSQEIVLDQLVRGLNDDEIQKKVLSTKEEEFNLDSVEKIIVAEESSKATQLESKGSQSGYVAPMSTYKKNKKLNVNQSGGKCKNCGGQGHQYRDLPDDEKSKCRAHGKTCNKCKKYNHFEAVCNTKSVRQKNDPEDAAENSSMAVLNNVAVDEGQQIKEMYKLNEVQSSAQSRRRFFQHLYFDKGLDKFVSRPMKQSNTMEVEITFDVENHLKLGGIAPRRKTFEKFKQDAVCDTGAAICCTGALNIDKVGINSSEILQSNLKLYAADRRQLYIKGCAPVQISTTDIHGSIVTIKEMLYFVEGLQRTFLSKDALVDLGVIPTKFPLAELSKMPEVSEITDEGEEDKASAECECPKRCVAPEPPVLPKPVETYSMEELKEILLDHYKASTFNTCQHQPLPLMHGPPLEFHVDDNVAPFVCHTPGAVPAHWEKKVKEDLDRDVALGVLEKVPPNSPVTWCHRMVLARKHNGDPRRTVDLQPLNKACKRQTHHTAPPLQQAMTVPHNSLKTTMDAWNGFHSVKIKESDRHYTTFITPWGRYRYASAPQGWLASGDGYTQRFDKITENVQKTRRVIDDVLLHHGDKKEAFEETAAYLTLVGKNGITMNPEKFHFAQDVVDWAGIKITRDSVEPLTEHIEAIRNYPRPTNISDMRSFFALVEQVAPFHAVKPHLAPFRELLKKNRKFYWDENLQKLFEEAKATIAKNVTDGLSRFETNRHTALLSDWSKTGIGFLMAQKYCGCSQINPTCCKGGWKVCMVGSRFTNQAESNYAPIEGECLAVTYALDKTKYYTLGLEKLTICVDHKPLLGILNEDTPLEKIENRRLIRLKEKTLGWRFKVIHIPGSKIGGPDALSRVSGSTINALEANAEMNHHFEVIDDQEDTKSGIFEAIRVPAQPMDFVDNEDALLSHIGLDVKSMTWEDVQKETEKDHTSLKLRQWITEGCQGPIESLDKDVKPYWRLKTHLRMLDGVPMLNNRTVIPRRLRQDVLDTLHAAHQGTSSMILRALDSVYWPGFVKDIERRRQQCFTCHKIAPSQAKLPPVDPVVPEYPFQHICMDYFQLNGKSYGIVVDRFTNWPMIYTGDTADDVCDVLAVVSRDYGIPETVSTDGAQCYVAEKVKNFMKLYGIKHRVSSVANAHSNCRAELGVKTVKRMIRDNTTLGGKFNNSKFSRALLQYRNTKDRDTGKSPAEFLLGRRLRDFMPIPKENLVGSEWKNLARQREIALSARGVQLKEQWSQNVRTLKPLIPGDTVFIQNQTGNNPLRWDKTGVVLEAKGYDQYKIMVDGSRRITLRNRKFLRKMEHTRVRYLPPVVPHRSEPVADDAVAVANQTEDDDFYTPNQTPTLSRANSHEHLEEELNNDEVVEPVDEQGRDAVPDEIVEDQGPVIEPEVLPRRSARANKGQTSKYQDYVMNNLEATATDMPINMIDRKGEDVNDSKDDVVVQLQDNNIQEREMHYGASGRVWFWRPWAIS